MSNTATKLAQQLQKQAVTQARKQHWQAERDRKARTRELVQVGGLAAKAGLDQFTKEEKLGGFIEMTQRAEKDPGLRAAWARKAAQILNPPPPPAKRAVEVQFASRPASTDGLKALGLKYNGIRRCWEGTVDADAARDLAASLGGQFRFIDQIEIDDDETVELPPVRSAGAK